MIVQDSTDVSMAFELIEDCYKWGNHVPSCPVQRVAAAGEWREVPIKVFQIKREINLPAYDC